MKIYNKTAMILFCGWALCSCADQYIVNGSSSVDLLEGKTLFLKTFSNNDMQTIDSTRVIHGKFRFQGYVDTAMMANVFLEGTSIMPLVLENGEIVVKINENTQSAIGTPLNDSLSMFILRKSQIDAQMQELPHLETQMIMKGVDHDAILYQLREKARKLEMDNDLLITHFISRNYDNVLGPGVFMILTSGLQYPIINPQIDQIISQGSPYFLNHPYVKEYIKAAEINMEKLREHAPR